MARLSLGFVDVVHEGAGLPERTFCWRFLARVPTVQVDQMDDFGSCHIGVRVSDASRVNEGKIRRDQKRVEWEVIAGDDGKQSKSSDRIEDEALVVVPRFVMDLEMVV